MSQELAFLADNGTISATQLQNFLRELPQETTADTIRSTQSAIPEPAPAAAMSNLSLSNSNGNYPNEKQDYNQPPPSYPAYPTPGPPAMAPLCHASALYAYNPTDAGDLALTPNDRVAVTEYMNAEWWKGTNERTRQEGIFPRSYVKVEEKSVEKLPTPAQAFGTNTPYEVANTQQGQPGEPGKPNKGAEMGKKFGKKMGNAAIFGAGATIGSNIVNGIF